MIGIQANALVPNKCNWYRQIGRLAFFATFIGFICGFLGCKSNNLSLVKPFSIDAHPSPNVSLTPEQWEAEFKKLEKRKEADLQMKASDHKPKQ